MPTSRSAKRRTTPKSSAGTSSARARVGASPKSAPTLVSKPAPKPARTVVPARAPSRGPVNGALVKGATPAAKRAATGPAAGVRKAAPDAGAAQRAPRAKPRAVPAAAASARVRTARTVVPAPKSASPKAPLRPAPAKSRPVSKAPATVAFKAVFKPATVLPAARASASLKDGRGTSRRGGKETRRLAAPATRLVRIKALDPCARCGPNTCVEQLYRVDEQVAGTATVHLVFFDRHGWYCVHGASCVAVRDVHAELKAQRAEAGRRR